MHISTLGTLFISHTNNQVNGVISMSNNQKPPTNKWIKEKEKYILNPKWLKSETTVVIYPEPDPKEVKVKGKFGDRQAYIVNTLEHGLIYITPAQLSKITELFAGKFESGITVTL